MRIEETILSSLIHNEEYSRKVLPFIDVAYFPDRGERAVVEEYTEFFQKFNARPTVDILKIELAQRNGITDPELESALSVLETVRVPPAAQNDEWLLGQTEKFCKDKSLYNAIIKSIGIIEGKDTVYNKDAIPKLLQDALGISFDSAVGHSYLDDAASRYDFYTRKEERVAFDIELLNLITNGGLPKKTLTILLAESGGGKSLGMSHFAAANLKMGKNVLYITMEMAEERIAERADANILNIEVDKIASLSKEDFLEKIARISKKTSGKYIIKEYPTGGAHAGHFRALIGDLKQKQNFVPDVIYIDYLGICASSRIKMGGGVNSYGYLKAIAEELRGLAVEFNVPVITAGQVNRGGFGSSDIDLTDAADSMGIIHTADLMLAIIRTEELDELNQVMFKQLKNRFNDPAKMRRFVVGLNRAKMKMYDLEMVAQSNISKDAKFTVAPQQQDTDDLPPLVSKSRRNLNSLKV